MPDSGAEITVMSAAMARHLGVQEEDLLPSPSIQISAANGQPMHCIGTFEAFISLQDRTARDTVYVFTEARGMLLAWYTAKSLGILPGHYPQPAALPSATRRVVATRPDAATRPPSSSPPPSYRQINAIACRERQQSLS